jgi:hypothetical protein
VAGVALALQLLLAGVLPLADASVEATAARPGIAVSDGGDDAPGQRLHDHLVCQFCRLLGEGALAAVGPSRVAVLVGPPLPPAPATAAAVTAATSPLPLGSRAPPRA